MNAVELVSDSRTETWYYWHCLLSSCLSPSSDAVGYAHNRRIQLSTPRQSCAFRQLTLVSAIAHPLPTFKASPITLSVMATTGRSLALISSIVNTPTPLPHIRHLTCTVAQVGPHQAALRHFIRTRLPVLRYHNPNMGVTVDRRKGGKGEKEAVRAEVVVDCVDGERVVVDALTTGRDSDIFQRIVEIGQRRAGRPNLPSATSTAAAVS